jgi:mannobiose 2-epimerase
VAGAGLVAGVPALGQLAPPAAVSPLPVELRTLIPEFETHYQNTVLNAWFPRSLDLSKGGYKCNFSYNWTDKGNHDKRIIFQSRLVFTASVGAMEYPGVAAYATAARHGYDFLRNKMWDTKYGGFYEGRSPSVGKHSTLGNEKRAYGNSFGIIGLVQYHKLSGDPAALELAIKCFEWMEKYVHDHTHGGYHFALSRENKVLTQSSSSKASDKYRFGYKDHNSHLHVLEAFTDLYEVWPDARVRTRLTELMDLIMNRMTDPRGYVGYFFSHDWKPLNSSRAEMDDDRMMFAHNMEFAYFMLRAVDVLGVTETPALTQFCQGLANTALAHGWDVEFGGMFTSGRFTGTTTCVIDDPIKERYAEGEPLLIFLFLAERYPEQSAWFTSWFLKQWEYVKRYSIDHTHPGWYREGIDRSPAAEQADKGFGTKAGYHDTRALLLSLKILKRI